MTHPASPTVKQTIFLSVILALAWLLWSGLYKPLLLTLGLLSCALTVIVVRRMEFFDKETYSLKPNLKLLRYWFWLLKEITHSSIAVTKVILNPSLPISPRVVSVTAPSDQSFDQVILGNSITLTPGTLTLDIHEGTLRVHTLTDEGARALLSGEMLERVERLSKDT
jgi:Multisubunit Na+/H+ antiporter, MnhE subunit